MSPAAEDKQIKDRLHNYFTIFESKKLHLDRQLLLKKAEEFNFSSDSVKDWDKSHKERFIESWKKNYLSHRFAFSFGPTIIKIKETPYLFGFTKYELVRQVGRYTCNQTSDVYFPRSWENWFGERYEYGENPNFRKVKSIIVYARAKDFDPEKYNTWPLNGQSVQNTKINDAKRSGTKPKSVKNRVQPPRGRGTVVNAQPSKTIPTQSKLLKSPDRPSLKPRTLTRSTRILKSNNGRTPPRFVTPDDGKLQAASENSRRRPVQKSRERIENRSTQISRPKPNANKRKHTEASGLPKFNGKSWTHKKFRAYNESKQDENAKIEKEAEEKRKRSIEAAATASGSNIPQTPIPTPEINKVSEDMGMGSFSNISGMSGLADCTFDEGYDDDDAISHISTYTQFSGLTDIVANVEAGILPPPTLSQIFDFNDIGNDAVINEQNCFSMELEDDFNPSPPVVPPWPKQELDDMRMELQNDDFPLSELCDFIQTLTEKQQEQLHEHEC